MGAAENLTRDAITREFMAAKAARAPLVYWSIIPGPGSAGLCDFVACAGGEFFGIEAKASREDGGKPPTAQQLRTIESIINAEGVALVVNDEVSFEVLHRCLMTATNYTWTRPAWRSDAVLKRRQPPPMR
ncbi:MAG: hypothetical protein RL260_1727 [Pseudomonadota bacterium]